MWAGKLLEQLCAERNECSRELCWRNNNHSTIDPWITVRPDEMRWWIKLRWDVTYTIIQSITSSDVFSAFNPSKCTHTWSSGHPGSSWGFGALLKGLTSVEDNSCWSRDSNPQPRVTSPTLYPLEPRLPPNEMRWLDEMRWDEMRWDEMRWDEMRWDEMRWDEMRWDEMSTEQFVSMYRTLGRWILTPYWSYYRNFISLLWHNGMMLKQETFPIHLTLYTIYT